MVKITFPLERPPSMHWMGVLMTGAVSGQLLVGALMIIGLLFMWELGFSVISIIFFVVFIMPMSFLLHKRLVSRGKNLMKPWCDIVLSDDIMKFKTGFPNTMDPAWQEIKITDKNRDILIKGSAETGYHLQLSGNAYPYLKFGSWLELNDAHKNAIELQKYLKGTIREDMKDMVKSSDLDTE